MSAALVAAALALISVGNADRHRRVLPRERYVDRKGAAIDLLTIGGVWLT